MLEDSKVAIEWDLALSNFWTMGNWVGSKKATDGNRTRITSLEGWGNGHYTTVAGRTLPYSYVDSSTDGPLSSAARLRSGRRVS